MAAADAIFFVGLFINPLESDAGSDALMIAVVEYLVVLSLNTPRRIARYKSCACSYRGHNEPVSNMLCINHFIKFDTDWLLFKLSKHIKVQGTCDIRYDMRQALSDSSPLSVHCSVWSFTRIITHHTHQFLRQSMLLRRSDPTFCF